MATYNGERYIEKQLNSIFSQLSENDEVIISDDNSSDKTVNIIQSYNDKRIKLLKADFKSPVFNFENAINHASGDYIFLSDQDDIWLAGRISEVLKIHKNENAQLVVAKAQLIDGNDRVFKQSFYIEDNPISSSFFKNLYRNPYLGCCISFDRKILKHILPFPRYIAMHDIWIGLITQINYKCYYYNKKPLVQYRRYGENFTAKNKYHFIGKIIYRIKIIIAIILRQIKVSKK
jgi:glycosyltransferase involved in cell wall biosynthesis